MRHSGTRSLLAKAGLHFGGSGPYGGLVWGTKGWLHWASHVGWLGILAKNITIFIFNIFLSVIVVQMSTH